MTIEPERVADINYLTDLVAHSYETSKTANGHHDDRVWAEHIAIAFKRPDLSSRIYELVTQVPLETFVRWDEVHLIQSSISSGRPTVAVSTGGLETQQVKLRVMGFSEDYIKNAIIEPSDDLKVASYLERKQLHDKVIYVDDKQSVLDKMITMNKEEGILDELIPILYLKGGKYVHNFLNNQELRDRAQEQGIITASSMQELQLILYQYPTHSLGHDIDDVLVETSRLKKEKNTIIAYGITQL